MNDPATLQLNTFIDVPNRGERGRRASWLLLGFALFMALLAGPYYLKIRHAPTRSAFLRWSNQIQDLRLGINIWEVHEYPNPPIMALVLMPFAQLPAIAGALAWFVCKALLTLLAVTGSGACWSILADSSFPTWAKLTGCCWPLVPSKET